MAFAIINGRRTELPDRVTTAEEIRRIGGIRDGRSVLQRTRVGNHLLTPGVPVEIHDGDVFVDAPARIKGRSAEGPR